MRKGTSDELLFVLQLLKGMEANQEEAVMARDLVLADLEKLINLIEEGQPIIDQAEVRMKDGSILRLTPHGRFERH